MLLTFRSSQPHCQIAVSRARLPAAARRVFLLGQWTGQRTTPHRICLAPLAPPSAKRNVIASAKRPRSGTTAPASGGRASRGDDDDDDSDDNDTTAGFVRERVEINTISTPLVTILTWVDRGTLNLQPDYQRDFVWDAPKCMNLIKTVYEGLPVPAVMLYKRHEGGQGEVYDVVDGKQRLVTLYTFLKGAKGCFPDAPTTIDLDSEDELAPVLHGRTFAGLSPEDRSFVENYSLQVQIIPGGTPPRVVYRIYEAINTGGGEHSAQQLRRAAFYGNYVELLNRLSLSPAGVRFKELGGMSQEEMKELLPEELILLFFALRRAADPREKWKFPSAMLQMLHQELQDPRQRAVRVLSPEDEQRMERIFEPTVNVVAELGLREAAEAALRAKPGVKVKTFRRTGSSGAAGPLWDTVLVGMSQALVECDRKGVYLRNKEAFQQRLRAFVDSAEWAAVASGKLTSRNLLARLRAFRLGVIEPVLGADLIGLQTEPRTFSRTDKLALYSAGLRCAWCDEPIASVDDAEVDHVVAYTRGGRTVLGNAQLLHPRCNRQRGTRDMSEGPAARAAQQRP